MRAVLKSASVERSLSIWKNDVITIILNTDVNCVQITVVSF